jgi:hypothetical protein
MGSLITGAALWAIIGQVTTVPGLALTAAYLLRRRVPGGRGKS